MPRLRAKRLFHYAVKQAFPGNDRNLTVKIFAAKKLHTSSQGVYANQKLGGTQECKRSRCQVQPFVSRLTTLATFASRPVQQANAGVLRTYRLQVKGLPSAAAAVAAPTFATRPLWQRNFHSGIAEANQAEERRKHSKAQSARLSSNPLWRYSQISPTEGKAMQAAARKGSQQSKKHARESFKWFAALDQRFQPQQQKSSSQPSAKTEQHVSMQSALRAYAKMGNRSRQGGSA